MKLYAISDLHLNHPENRRTLTAIRARPRDWLILNGDIGESARHLRFALEILGERFAQLIWTPGNHDLWTHPRDPSGRRGEEKYEELVSVCRAAGVLTPEDPYPLWAGEGGRCILIPLHLLYDYSFRPDEVAPGEALKWAAATGVMCADELLLHADPYDSRSAWCHARVEAARPRLAEAAGRAPTVLINHFPLRRDLIRLHRIPRFSLWCGTRLTEDWHRRYRARVVVSGHLHMRATDWRDGVRFEEVSLGYPKHWRRDAGADHYLREILPGPPTPEAPAPPTQWHR